MRALQRLSQQDLTTLDSPSGLETEPTETQAVQSLGAGQGVATRPVTPSVERASSNETAAAVLQGQSTGAAHRQSAHIIPSQLSGAKLLSMLQPKQISKGTSQLPDPRNQAVQKSPIKSRPSGQQASGAVLLRMLQRRDSPQPSSHHPPPPQPSTGRLSVHCSLAQ